MGILFSDTVTKNFTSHTLSIKCQKNSGPTVAFASQGNYYLHVKLDFQSGQWENYGF